MSTELMKRLRACPARAELVHHRFFRDVVNDNSVTRRDVAEVIGQWWHPLHYFPTFLARSIAVFDSLEHRSFVADILNEELGDGDPSQAHERIYISTMQKVGFSLAEITQSLPFPETKQLLNSYAEGSEERLSALGCTFATEVADLAMVGGIGKLVRRVAGEMELPWVDIHIQQEPNHVDKVTMSLGSDFSAGDMEIVIDAAERHWHHWCRFFDALHDTVRIPA